MKNEYGKVIFRTDGDGLVATVCGEVDHHNSRAIRAMIDDRLFIERPRELVLDLSRVSFMDSSGLGLILGRYSKASELGVSFRISNPTEQTKKILDLAGVERIVRVSSDVPRGRKEEKAV